MGSHTLLDIIYMHMAACSSLIKEQKNHLGLELMKGP